MPNPSNHVYALKHVYVPVWLSRHFMNPDHALCYKAGVLTPTEGIGDELVQVVHLQTPRRGNLARGFLVSGGARRGLGAWGKVYAAWVNRRTVTGASDWRAAGS